MLSAPCSECTRGSAPQTMNHLYVITSEVEKSADRPYILMQMRLETFLDF